MVVPKLMAHKTQDPYDRTPKTWGSPKLLALASYHFGVCG